jgi:P27 family predicted phage terminase small subunit
MPSSRRPSKIIPLAQRLARPEPNAPPAPPKFLEGDALAEWHRIAPELHRTGRLSVLGTGPLAGYCRAWATWKAAEEAIACQAAAREAEDDGLIVCSPYNGRPRANPMLKTAATACRAMVAIAREFGMTPQSRSALGNLAAHR